MRTIQLIVLTVRVIVHDVFFMDQILNKNEKLTSCSERTDESIQLTYFESFALYALWSFNEWMIEVIP